MPYPLNNKKTIPNLSVILLIAFSAFTFIALQFNREAARTRPTPEMHYGFTLPAEIQVLLFAGDRYLASNIEFINTAAGNIGGNSSDVAYSASALKLVAELNPCYEDNLYFSNAFLSWGGMPEAGNQILEQSTSCRTWDDVPPFFLGFNRFFFFRDLKGAQKSLQLAIDRSDNNTVALQRLYISIESEKFDDRELALAYLEHERDQASDTELKTALHKRIGRLKGLIFLENAQAEFERKFNRPLSNPQELIEQGIITSYPTDPLGIGYEFRDNAFHFRQLRIN
jgi:hypothetical protein